MPSVVTGTIEVLETVLLQAGEAPTDRAEHFSIVFVESAVTIGQWDYCNCLLLMKLIPLAVFYRVV